MGEYLNGHERIKNESKEWLTASLLDLMKKKSYEDITVGQIADHAKLSRRTFYRAFRNKDDVMDYITDQICLEYEEHLSKFNLQEFKIETVSYVFFSFFEKYFDLLLCFKKNNLEFQILKLFNQYIPVLYKKMVKSNVKEDAVQLKHFFLYNAGGFFNNLIYWLENENRLSAEEMSKIISSAINKYLKPVVN